MVKPILHRMGKRGSSGLQRVGGSELGAPRGEDRGVIVAGGKTGLTMFGDGKDFVWGRMKDRRKGCTGLTSRPGRRHGVEDEEKSLGTS